MMGPKQIRILLFTPMWKNSGAFLLALLPMASGSGRGVPLPALGSHSSFLPLSFLEREQQGGNCLSSPRTAGGRKLWQAPSSPRSGIPGGAVPCSSPWLAHFWMHFIHMPPVRCSSRIGTGSLSEPKQGSLLQVETRGVAGRCA